MSTTPPTAPAADAAAADEEVTFDSLGIHADLCKILELRKWVKPTAIQAAAIPPILEGRDVVGLATTGSGKTGAFLLPILQSLISGKAPHPFYAAILSPTRELTLQIASELKLLIITFPITYSTLVGGLSSAAQKKELQKSPHIVIGTPGRVADMLQTQKLFDLSLLKFLVIDEADRLLTPEFEGSLYKVINGANPKRQTLLFSATMTSKVTKLQRASLNKPVKVQVDENRQVARGLAQYLAFVSEKDKMAFVAVLVQRWPPKSRAILFCNTCKVAGILSTFLRRLKFECVALSGDMNQTQRLASLNQFKNKSKEILVTTDIAARGMDLPCVEYVVNFDVPAHHKTYIHRVGRTARAGREGTAFTIVTKREALQYKKIELKIFGTDQDAWPTVYKDLKKEDYQLDELERAQTESMQEYVKAKQRKKKR